MVKGAAQLSQIHETVTKLLNDLKQTAQTTLTTPVETKLLEGFPADEIGLRSDRHGDAWANRSQALAARVGRRICRTASCAVLTVRQRAEP
jgi:hypothetical protein